MHCGGRRCALPPAPPRPPLCVAFFLSAPFATYSHSFFGFILQYFYWYLSRVVLATHCGGRRCALPPAPPRPPLCVAFFFIGSFCYLLSLLFLGSSYNIFIDIYRELFLLRIAGGGAAPSPLHPATRFYILLLFFNRLPATYSHSFFLVHLTSSTAQGGGGSFKNRKPIGEIDCCESRMAERIHWLTERWLELCLLEWLQWLQWSPHPQLLDVVWCTATVVVVVA